MKQLEFASMSPILKDAYLKVLNVLRADWQIPLEREKEHQANSLTRVVSSQISSPGVKTLQKNNPNIFDNNL